MRNNIGAISPSIIMSLIVMLIILFVGIFAFFAVMDSIKDVDEEEAQKELEEMDPNPIYDLLPMVLIIGGIMIIVGLVYGFLIGPSTNKPSVTRIKDEDIDKQVIKQRDLFPNIPKTIKDYKLHGVYDIDNALNTAKVLRENAYWAKLVKYPYKKYKLPADKNCAVYVSKWKKDDINNEKPKWR